MESSISLALSAQMTLRRKLDLLANNMANADTAGFKLEAQVVQARSRGRHGAEADARVIYPLDRGSFTDLRQGALEPTGNPLDIAVEGEGFLAVQGPDGQRLTRDGRLSLAPDGTLLGAGDLPVVGVGGGSLALPPEAVSVTISDDGTVQADGQEIGQIGRFMPAAGASLAREADGLFSVLGATAPDEASTIRQGVVEGSNVQTIRELTDLIEVQRGYERAQRILDGEDERIRKTVADAVRV